MFIVKYMQVNVEVNWCIGAEQAADPAVSERDSLQLNPYLVRE